MDKVDMKKAVNFFIDITDGDLSGLSVAYKDKEIPISGSELGKLFITFVKQFVAPIKKYAEDEQKPENPEKEAKWQELQNKSKFLQDLTTEVYNSLGLNINAYMAYVEMIKKLKECGAMTKDGNVVGVHHEDQRQVLQESLNEIKELYKK
jgi:SPX domain protein involved in polyphosphate accumulation